VLDGGFQIERHSKLVCVCRLDTDAERRRGGYPGGTLRFHCFAPRFPEDQNKANEFRSCPAFGSNACYTASDLSAVAHPCPAPWADAVCDKARIGRPVISAGGVRGKRMGLVTWQKSGSPRKAQEHLEKRSTLMAQLLKSTGIIEINLSHALI